MAKVDAWMAQRQEIANELHAAAATIMSGESPLQWGDRATVTKAALVHNRRNRRKMSAAARKRISDAQRARWAKQKAAATTVAKGRRKDRRPHPPKA